MRSLAEVDPGIVELAHDRQHDDWPPGLTHEQVTISIALPEADLKHIDEFVV